MKDLFIDAVDFVDFGGYSSIPTAIYFSGPDNYSIGYDAKTRETSTLRANRGFKIDLGGISTKSAAENRAKFRTALGGDKTAFEISRNFILSALSHGQSWLQNESLTPAGNIIVAEPLQFSVDNEHKDWLKNYRKQLKRILDTYYPSVEFLPEPFAVFQYYRHKARHPLLQSRRKYVALVLDFGGGTFDSSVIETTKVGNLSNSGAQCKPFAADSQEIGGLTIDKAIAKYCMLKAMPDDRTKKELRQVFSRIPNWNATTLADLNDRNRAVYDWLVNTGHAAEDTKISLCRKIADWDLSNQPAVASDLNVPSNPYDSRSKMVTVEFSAKEFYSVFKKDVWDLKLRSAINNALRRASAELDGKTVNLLLLSGGSCNIGWVKELLFSEFENELSAAEVIALTKDFQTIVAQGLAVECARRHILNDSVVDYSSIQGVYSPANLGNEEDPNGERCARQAPAEKPPDEIQYSNSAPVESSAPTDQPVLGSDFDGVSYNTLALAISVDEDENFQFVRLKPWQETKNILAECDRGIVMPSGSVLNAVVNTTVSWSLDVKKSPRRRLNYRFLRSNKLPIENSDVYNVESGMIDTKGFKSFGSHIWLQLIVEADGTCRPSFVYGRDENGRPEAVRPCVPFALDTTAISIFDSLPRTLEQPPPSGVKTALDDTTLAPYEHEPQVQAATTAEDAPETIDATREQEPQSAFFGFDFGTTNCSLSYVSRRSVEVTKLRSTDHQWGSLKDSLPMLPTAVAHAASNYLAPRDELEQDRRAFSLFEAAYSFMAYCCYSELRATTRKKSKIFADYQRKHRSAGPLLGLLRSSLEGLGSRAQICAPLIRFKSKLLIDAEAVCEELNAFKHEKKSKLSAKSRHFCEESAMIVASLLEDKIFGVFYDIKRPPFEDVTTASFRCFHGLPPFLDTATAKSNSEVHPDLLYIIDPSSGVSVCLAPLVVTHLDQSLEEVWFFDGQAKNGDWEYKATSKNDNFLVSEANSPGFFSVLGELSGSDRSHAGDIENALTISGHDS